MFVGRLLFFFGVGAYKSVFAQLPSPSQSLSAVCFVVFDIFHFLLLPGAGCFFAPVDVFHAQGDDDEDHDGGGDDSDVDVDDDDDDDDDAQGHSSGIDEADGDLKGKVYWMETTNLPECWSREGTDSCVARLAIVANCEVMWQRGWCHAGGPTQGRPNPCIF